MSDERLANNRIDVWQLDLRDNFDPALLRQYSAWLNADETRRRERFRFARDRRRYLLTRALLRGALSHYCRDVAEARWRFSSNQYGRPRIADELASQAALQFNLAHSGDLIVVAVCRRGEIGVDIEHTQRAASVAEVAEHFFAPWEVCDLLDLPADRQRDRFFDLWTLKEAYIKARGLGLALPLDSFGFHFGTQARIKMQIEPTANDGTDGWQFWQLTPVTDYRLALAWRDRHDATAMQATLVRVLPGQPATPVACLLPARDRVIRPGAPQ